MTHLAGIDIGGTKCGVCMAWLRPVHIKISISDGATRTAGVSAGRAHRWTEALLEVHPEVALSAVGRQVAAAPWIAPKA